MRKNEQVGGLPKQRRRPKHRPEAASGLDAADGNPYYTKTVGRALDVLEAFEHDQSQLSFKELSQFIEMPAPSLFRLLSTLETRGYLVRQPDGAFRLSDKVLYGKLIERAQRMRTLFHSELQQLASQFNESASLAYLFGDHIQVLDAVETFHEIRITNKPGRLLPPHCSAMGKAITAHQERPIRDRILEVYGLDRRTPTTIVDRPVLLADFELILQRGYALDREESVEGGLCIGAAIAPPGARVVAAISVSTPLVRMSATREEEIIAGVRTAAANMARVWEDDQPSIKRTSTGA